MGSKEKQSVLFLLTSKISWTTDYTCPTTMTKQLSTFPLSATTPRRSLHVCNLFISPPPPQRLFTDLRLVPSRGGIGKMFSFISQEPSKPDTILEAEFQQFIQKVTTLICLCHFPSLPFPLSLLYIILQSHFMFIIILLFHFFVIVYLLIYLFFSTTKTMQASKSTKPDLRLSRRPSSSSTSTTLIPPKHVSAGERREKGKMESGDDERDRRTQMTNKCI